MAQGIREERESPFPKAIEDSDVATENPRPSLSFLWSLRILSCTLACATIRMLIPFLHDSVEANATT